MRLQRSLKNSLFVYIRLLFTALSSLLGVALLYRSLGVEVFGFLSLILAIIALANFLNLAVSTTSQRFLAVDTSQNNFLESGLNNLINITFILISILIYFALSTTGWSYFESLYNAHADIEILKYSFTILIASATITNMHAIFVVRLLANESFKIFAAISIIDAISKLLISSLIYLIEDFYLVEYAFGLLINSIIIFCLYLVFFLFNSWKILDNKLPTRDLVSNFTKFFFWTVFGSASSAVRIQGITLALGVLFTPAIVSARAIGLQAANSSRTLSQNLNLVLYPSLLKTFNLVERDRWNLLHTGCKLTFYFTFVLVCPMLFYADEILLLWLGSYSHETKSFVSLMLLEVLIFSVSLPLTSVARASDHIGTYEFQLGLSQFILLPVAIIAMVISKEPTAVVYSAIFMNIVMLVQRIVFLQRYMKLNLFYLWQDCLRYVLLIAIQCTVIMFLLYHFLHWTFGITLFFVLTAPVIYFRGLNRGERLVIRSILGFARKNTDVV